MLNEEVIIINQLKAFSASSSTEYDFEVFKNKLSNEFRKGLLNIVLHQDYDLKILAFSAIKFFNIPLSLDEARQFFYPLLKEPRFQDFAAELIVRSIDHETILNDLFPLIEGNIETGDYENQIIISQALVFCSFYMVEIHKIRNDKIIRDLLHILKFCNVGIENKKLALITIIKQFLIHSDEVSFLDFLVIIRLLFNIEVNDQNIYLLYYILSFIKQNTDLIIQKADDIPFLDILNQLNIILNYIISKFPFHPDDHIMSTNIYNIFRIISDLDMNFFVPIDKLFYILTFGEEQFIRVKTDADYFFDMFLGCSDNHSVNPYENESIESDELSEKYWNYFYDIQTLNDAQSAIRFYIFSQSNEYKENVFNYCMSIMNNSIFVNLAIIILFSESSFSSKLMPAQMNDYNDNVLQFLLIDYYFMQFSENPSEQSPYFIYLQQNFKIFTEYMLNSEDKISLLCLFRVIQDCPIKFVEPKIYVSTLQKTIFTVFPSFQYDESKVNFIQKILDYLSPNGVSPEENSVFIFNSDPESRRFITSSIFKLEVQYIAEFKCSNEFFNTLQLLLSHCIANSEMLAGFIEIIQYFAGNDIFKYISRNRQSDASDNRISDYKLFFPEIIQCILPLILNHLPNPSMLESCYMLFISIFSYTIFFDVENYKGFLSHMYIHFIQCNFGELENIKEIRLVPKIFMKNGLFEQMDIFCYNLCLSNIYLIPSLVSELSFILMNQENIYSDDYIIQLNSLLLNLLSDDKITHFVRSIACIYARVALYDKNRLLALLGNYTEVFLMVVFKELKQQKFLGYHELEQRMIIALYLLFRENENMAKISKIFLKLMLQSLDHIFSNPRNQNIKFSSLSLIKEVYFYDDLDFLNHPLISMSISQLIQYTQTEKYFGSFLEKYNNLVL